MPSKPELSKVRPAVGAVLVKPEGKPPKTVAHIADCTITTDSVVATAAIRTTGKMRRIIAQWGDGAVSTLRARPGVDMGAVAQPDPMPSGTYRLTHAYAGPQDKKPFDQFVQIRVEDDSGVDFCIKQITLTPRYRVTNYRTTLILDGKCDSWFESQSEFEITQVVDGQPVRAWTWNAPESSVTGNVVLDIPQYLLDGSQVSRELAQADPPVPVSLDIVEKDQWFDAELAADQRLDLYWPPAMTAPTMFEPFERVTEDDGCKLKVRWDREVTLIVPLPPTGQEITFNS